MKTIIVNQTSEALNEKNINQMTQKVLSFLKAKRIRQKKLLSLNELTLVFLKSADMKKINFQFRKKNKPTDVLSFAPSDSDSLGELLFCCDVLKKQAREQKHSEGHEFLYMLIHGMLHLLGYDHELSQKEEKLMFNIQDQIFHELTELKINLQYKNVNRNRT